MKRFLPFALALLLTLPASLAAQEVSPAKKKLYGTAQIALRQYLSKQRAARGTAGEEPFSGIVTTSAPNEVRDSVLAWGGKCTVIDEEVVTIALPFSHLERLAEMACVARIDQARRARPLLHVARAMMNVDDVHAGKDLDSPFAGKGVLVGIVDGGFQYDHIAFKNAAQQSRIKASWNHYSGDAPQEQAPSKSFDGDAGTGGHATHVANIAAGSPIAGNNLRGVAPEADLAFVSTTFNTADLLEEAKWLRDYAKKMGQPIVINMSLGSQDGPHDGTDGYSKAMNRLLGEGTILVGAMGNEGEGALHAQHLFTQAGESKTLLLNNKYQGKQCEGACLYVSGTKTDKRSHLSFKPFVYNAGTKQRNYLTPAAWQNVTEQYIDEDSQKEGYYLLVDKLKAICTQAGVTKDADGYIGVEIIGEANAGFHAWAFYFDRGYGEFIAKDGLGIDGDDKYCVSEAAAAVTDAIAVGSCNGAPAFTSAYDGKGYAFGAATPQFGVSYFSSRGPYLGQGNKPDVVAPGHTISSAICKHPTAQFDNSDISIVSAVQAKTGIAVSHENYASASTLKTDYYGVMSGTSMAAPAVTGCIALWLQVNPKLTPADIKEVIKATAYKHPLYGSAEWDENRGYGVIDAYAGLKEVLKRSVGVREILNAEQPVTFSKESEGWRVLFNNNESYAHISLRNLSGATLWAQQIASPRCGDEVNVDLSPLTPGVYLICVETTRGQIVRKVMKR